MDNNTIFSLVLCVKDSDFELIKNNIPILKENLNPKEIIIISSNKINSNYDKQSAIHFLDEDLVYPNMTFKSVHEYLKKLNIDPKVTGWYFQQFLKMSFCFISDKEYYLVWDADTIPLRKLSFFSEEAKPFFDLKREYEKNYFDTISKLFGLKKVRNESYISEHMLFNTNIMKELITKIENNDEIEGITFWQKILNASSITNCESQNFSEFETYGTYTDFYYSNKYAIRRMQSLRYGTFFLGNSPTPEILQWASKSFDIISFEHWDKSFPLALKKTNNKKYIQHHSLAFMIKEILLFSEIKLFLSRLLRFNFSELLHGKSFRSGFRSDFFFYKNPEYNEIGN